MDINWIWQSAVDFAASHLPYVSPFWWWIFVGTVTVAATTGTAALLSFYFPSTVVAKFARMGSGLVFIGSVIWLFGLSPRRDGRRNTCGSREETRSTQRSERAEVVMPDNENSESVSFETFARSTPDEKLYSILLRQNSHNQQLRTFSSALDELKRKVDGIRYVPLDALDNL